MKGRPGNRVRDSEEKKKLEGRTKERKMRKKRGVQVTHFLWREGMHDAENIPLQLCYKCKNMIDHFRGKNKCLLGRGFLFLNLGPF